jgi:hypothetical protein
VRVTVDDRDVDYEVIGSVLYANYDALELRYCVNYTAIDDAVAWPDDFAEVLAIGLAIDLAMTLTQNPSVKQTLEREYQMALASARFNGAVERSGPEVIETSSWINSHSGFFSDIGSKNINGNEPL